MSLHQCPTAHADNNHEEPAGNGSETPDDVSKRLEKVILGEPAVCRVECALVGGLVLVRLLGVNLVDCLRGHGSRVHVDDV